MGVKDAASKAGACLVELYTDEGITNVGLEEAVFDDRSGDWKITVGSSRPRDQHNAPTATLAGVHPNRSHKAIRINDQDGRVISLTDRLLAANGGQMRATGYLIDANPLMRTLCSCWWWEASVRI